jgi:ankyrin repeat protein
LLLEAGADINAQSNYGHTALMLARNHKIVELLRKAGAKEYVDL